MKRERKAPGTRTVEAPDGRDVPSGCRSIHIEVGAWLDPRTPRGDEAIQAISGQIHRSGTSVGFVAECRPTIENGRAKRRLFAVIAGGGLLTCVPFETKILGHCYGERGSIRGFVAAPEDAEALTAELADFVTKASVLVPV